MANRLIVLSSLDRSKAGFEHMGERKEVGWESATTSLHPGRRWSGIRGGGSWEAEEVGRGKAKGEKKEPGTSLFWGPFPPAPPNNAEENGRGFFLEKKIGALMVALQHCLG